MFREDLNVLMVSAFKAPTLRARARGGNPTQSLALGRRFLWADTVYRYEGIEPLLATLAEKVIAPAEGKVKALEERRRVIEAELTKSQ
jgi:hypothetical protein